MQKFSRLSKELKQKICKNCGENYCKPVHWSNNSWLANKYCSQKCKNKDMSYLKKISQSHLGQIAWNKGNGEWKNCMTCELKIRKRRKYCSRKCQPSPTKGISATWIVGEKNPNWKGGITPINKAIRESLEYEEWRKTCMERDLYTCQGCGKVGGYLEVDHIKPFSLFPELRLVLSNGRTLCKPCHKKLGWELFREKNPRRVGY